MNVLLKAMISSLEDLKKGLNGQLNMSEAMEDLASALSIDQVNSLFDVVVNLFRILLVNR